MEILDQISTTLQNGDHEQVGELVGQAITDQLPAAQIPNGGLLAGMDVVGERFRDREIFLPDVLLAARAMYAGLDLVQQRGLADQVKTIVGGAPVSEEYAREIGADAYGFDAANAVQRVRTLAGVG